MKSTGTMNGGGISSQYVNSCKSRRNSSRLKNRNIVLLTRMVESYTDATYLLKCVQGFNSKGLLPYAISIQNEPENSNPTYPSASVPVATEAQIGTTLRSLLNSNGFSGVKIIGYEHNWVDAGAYPVQLVSFDATYLLVWDNTLMMNSDATSWRCILWRVIPLLPG